MHQKQNSQELAELPHLLTSKVLELQQGLNKICAASKGNLRKTILMVLFLFNFVFAEVEPKISPERENSEVCC